jgi:hypothetical protein
MGAILSCLGMTRRRRAALPENFESWCEKNSATWRPRMCSYCRALYQRI